MLDSADILPDRQPAFRNRPVERSVLGLAGEPNEIPGRIGERIERIGLAQRLATARRAGDVLPRRVAIERVAGNVKANILGAATTGS